MIGREVITVKQVTKIRYTGSLIVPMYELKGSGKTDNSLLSAYKLSVFNVQFVFVTEWFHSF